MSQKWNVTVLNLTTSPRRPPHSLFHDFWQEIIGKKSYVNLQCYIF